MERREVAVMTDEVEETDKFLYTDVLNEFFNRVFNNGTRQVEMDLMIKMRRGIEQEVNNFVDEFEFRFPKGVSLMEKVNWLKHNEMINEMFHENLKMLIRIGNVGAHDFDGRDLPSELNIREYLTIYEKQ